MFIAKKLPTEMMGKDIVIVDDIYTTGATIRHAAKALKKQGAETIFSLTVARTKLKKFR
jgi:competence protein ComFC